MSATRKVDHAAIRVNQGVLISLNFLAFVLNLPWLVAVVTLFMLGGTLLKRPGFGFIFHRILKPLGVMQSEILDDHAEPHRFAQMFGGVVMLVGTVMLFLGLNLVGWVLVWLVLALAALNLFGGFCVGCAMYYWLNRLRVPGFVKSPPPGTRLPGARPGAN